MRHRYDDDSGISLYKETKWLEFIIVAKKPRTLVLHVYNKKAHLLGEIRWHGPWRQYTFQPCGKGEPIFNNGCLQDITDVLTELNKAQKRSN